MRATPKNASDTGRIYVYWEGEDRYIKRIDESPAVGQGAAIPYPADPGDACDDWFGSKNPGGVAVERGPATWSIVASKRTDGRLRYFLRDCQAAIREIDYCEFHHAVFFEDWSDFEQAIEHSLKVIDALKEKFSAMTTKVQEILSDLPTSEQERRIFLNKLLNEIRPLHAILTKWLDSQHQDVGKKLKWVMADIDDAKETYDRCLKQL